MNRPRPKVIIQGLTYGFQEVIKATFAIKPLRPEVVFVEANATDVADAAPCKCYKIRRTTGSLGNLTDFLRYNG